MLPMQDVDQAIKEMTFARKELGMKGGFLRPNPYNDRLIHDPVYEPFWSAAEDLDFSIGFHEGASAGMPQVGIDRFATRGARHIITHTMEMMLAALSMIWGGVCERHPKLRVGFLESGGGWIAPWLDRMDRHFTIRASTTAGSRCGPPTSSGGNAGFPSSRSRVVFMRSPITSARTRSCGRPTIRTRTGSSPARPTWSESSLKGFRLKPSIRSWPAAPLASMA
jgi:Amidohydrolase